MAKKIDASARSLNDTRGLPATMDPRMFYEYSSQRRYEQADGLEGLLYRLLPRSLIASFAYAIDPLSQIKMSSGKISPAVRTRRSTSTSVLQSRKRKYHHASKTIDTRYPDPGWTITNSTTVIGSQLALSNHTLDTTKRLRVAGSSNGEFTKWKIYPRSTGRTVRKAYHNHVYYPSPGYWYRSDDYQVFEWLGQSARVSPTTANNLYTSESTLALALMQKQALGMFKGIFPSRRTYTLFRNIVELRDIPHSIIQLRDTIGHLSKFYGSMTIPHKVRLLTSNLKASLDDIPKEWLSYSFGWRQTYSDMMGLLRSPAKIAKKIDFLVRRSGKATTFRSIRSFESNGVASSGFDYDISSVEFGNTIEHRVNRASELRLVVNAGLEFPPTDIPNLRRNEFLRQMGVSPTFTDFYNLVPWTWLIDWFSGLGDYVEIIDNINQDPTLVNWGLMTAVVQGSITSNYTSKVYNDTYSGIAGSVTEERKLVHYSHQSNLDFNLQLRKDMSTLFDVNVATDLSTLTEFQQSILGSLLFTRTQKFRR